MIWRDDKLEEEFKSYVETLNPDQRIYFIRQQLVNDIINCLRSEFHKYETGKRFRSSTNIT